MDKLPEPYFEVDKTWPRMRNGVDEYIKEKEKNYLPIFAILAGASIFRYYREVTFYKKDLMFFLAVICPTFLFSSQQIAKFLTRDAHAYAALENNRKEQDFHNELKQRWKECKRKGIELPDELVLL